MDIGVIYSLTNTKTQERYIGFTCNPVGREKTHMMTLRCGTHQNRLIRESCEKYGHGCFVFEVIEKDVLISNATERENHWMTHYKTLTKGFNMKWSFHSNAVVNRENNEMIRNIIRRRLALKMTRKALAIKTGVPFATLFRYEHGLSKIPHERFLAIDHVLSREEMKAATGNPKL